MRPILLLLLPAILAAEEKVDLYTINRIKVEAFQNSKVMDHAFHLTDVYGPRLTGSPGLLAAAEWAAREMSAWGLVNTGLEKWGPFGRGWTSVHFSAHQKEPQYAPLVGFARPWSPGTQGPVSGEPVIAVMKAEEDFQKFKGKLKGKIVLLEEAKPLAPENEAELKRYSEAELVEQSNAPDPSDRSQFTNPIPLIPAQRHARLAPGADLPETVRRARNTVTS